MSTENGSFMDMIRKNPVTTGLISFAVLALLIILIVMMMKKNQNTTPKPTTKEGFSFSDTFSLSNMTNEDADHIGLGGGYEENGYDYEKEEDEIVENFPQPAPMNVMYSDANGNLATTTDLGLQNLTVTGDPNAKDGSSMLVNGGANFKPAISINAPVVPESLYSIHFGDGKDVHNRQTGIGYIKGQPNAKFGATRGTLATHIHRDDDYQIITSGWDPIFALKGGSGDAFIKGSLSNGGNMSTSKNLHTQRNRVCFSDTASDPNHSIYNNYTNIDGEGGWDGMKMNTYAGLDIRTGNASGAVPATRLSVRDTGISVNGDAVVGGKLSAGSINTGSIQIGSWNISEDASGHLVFSRGGAGWDSSKGTDQGHIRMTQDGNLWLSRSTGWGWTADKLGDLHNYVHRKPEVRQVSTGASFNNGGILYLDRQDIKCNDDEYLSRWHHVNHGGEHGRFDYTCVKR